MSGDDAIGIGMEDVRADHEDLSNMMSIDVRKTFRESSFKGVPRIIWSWMNKLAKMYPDTLCLISECREAGHMASFKFDHPERGVYMKEATKQKVRSRCPGKPFTAFVLVFMSSETELHANAVLVDRTRRKMVRFEPRGSRQSYDKTTLDNALRDFAKEVSGMIGVPLEYVSPLEYEVYAGPQTKELLDVGGDKDALSSTGPCAAWSMLFCHMAVAFPDKDYKAIARALSNPMVSTVNLAQFYTNIIMRDVEILPEC